MSRFRLYRPWLWRLCLFLSPAVILAAVELLNRTEPAQAAAWVFRAPGPALFTYGVLLGLVYLFTLLTRRLWVGYLIPALPAVIFAVANYLKLSANGVPIQLSELAMALQVGQLMGFLGSGLRVGPWAVFAIVLAVGTAAALFFLADRPRSDFPSRKPRALLSGGVAVALALAIAFPLPLGEPDPTEDQAMRNADLGLLGGIYSGFLSRGVDYGDRRPVGTILNETEPSATPSPEPTQEPVRPHVVMLMSESFVDPTELFPQVTYREDPLPNFHALKETAQTGTFLSNTYGGGTGMVEMEVLTAFPTVFIPEGNNLCSLPGFPEVYSSIPSVPRVFAQAGYHTRYIHNYDDHLFNRGETMWRMGFESVLFDRDFPADAPHSGPYLADQALAQQVISAFETRTDDAPLFIYAVSMENHQPYSYDKFGGPSPLETACPELDETMLGMVDAVAWGVHGADAALGTLVEYLETLDEPVLLVFWGDHKPGLYTDPAHSVFAELGAVPSADRTNWSLDTLKYITKTPLLVWTNYDAGLDVPEEVGNNGLGALTLSWAGVEPTPYFRWVQQSISSMLLFRARLFVDGNGDVYDRPPEEAQAMVDDYRSLVRSYFDLTEEPEPSPEPDGS